MGQRAAAGTTAVHRGVLAMTLDAFRRSAVRMAQRDTDFLTSVLEREHVFSVGQQGEFCGPVSPHINDGVYSLVGQVGNDVA